mmetsp:Transcript_9811/g.19308  ORF Transcript_9811/g.19308 Transcript_9811/m.19308 type:complete len:176 (-) Transcript_9811:3604-4131(-)
MNEIFTDKTQPPSHTLPCLNPLDDYETREGSVVRMQQPTPKKGRTSNSPAFGLPQSHSAATEKAELENSLSQMMSPTVQSRKRRREDFTTHAVKRFRGVRRTVEYVNVELKHWDESRSEFFRCFYDCEIVPPAVSFTMIESIFDDDCPTDDETIATAQASLKRNLEDAILSHLAN